MNAEKNRFFGMCLLVLLTNVFLMIHLSAEKVLVVPTAFPKETISGNLVGSIPETADSFNDLKNYYEDTWAPFFEVQSYGQFNVETTVTDYVFAQWGLNHSANLAGDYWFTEHIVGPTKADDVAVGEEVVDGVWTPGERYIDADGSGDYTQMEEWWDTTFTADGGTKKEWDAFGEEFADWDENGEYSSNVTSIIVYDEANDLGTGDDAGGVAGDGYYGLPVFAGNLANVVFTNINELDLNDGNHINSSNVYTADLSGDRAWTIYLSDMENVTNGDNLANDGNTTSAAKNGTFDAPVDENGDIMYDAVNGFITEIGTASYKRAISTNGNTATITTISVPIYRAAEKFVDSAATNDRVWNDRDPFEDFMVRWEPRYNPKGLTSPPGGWVPVSDAYINANYPGTGLNQLLATSGNRTNNSKYDAADGFNNNVDQKIQVKGFNTGINVAFGGNWDPHNVTGLAGVPTDADIIAAWWAMAFDPVSAGALTDAFGDINSKFMNTSFGTGVFHDWIFQEFEGYGSGSLVNPNANGFSTGWVGFSDLETNADFATTVRSGIYNRYDSINGTNSGNILPTKFYDSLREFRDLPSSLYHVGGDLRFGEETDPNSDARYGVDIGGTITFPNVFPDQFIEHAGPLGHSAFGDKGFDAGSVAALELLTWGIESNFGGSANNVRNANLCLGDAAFRDCRDVNLDGLIDQGASPPDGFSNYLVTNLAGDRGDGTNVNAGAYPFNRVRLIEEMLEYTDSGLDFDNFSSTANFIDYVISAIPTAYDGSKFQGQSGLAFRSFTQDSPAVFTGRGQPEPTPSSGALSAHEYLHDAWGTTDLYDYDAFNGFRENFPIGSFDIMATGGFTMSPVSKANLAGIVQYRSLNTLLIPDQEETIEIYPHNFIENGNEYFSFDSFDGDGERFIFYYDSGYSDYTTGYKGLVILHEDANTTGEAVPLQNRIGDHSQYQIVEADGTGGMADGTSQGSASSVFGSVKTTFNIETNPKAEWWDGKDSGLEIVNIELPTGSSSTDPVRVTFKVKSIMVPSLSFNNPPGGTSSGQSSFSIQANVIDNFGATSIQIFRDVDNVGYDGTLVGAIVKSGGGLETQSLADSVVGLADGDYYYYAQLAPGTDVDSNTESGNFIVSQLNGGTGHLIVNSQPFGGSGNSTAEVWTFECTTAGGNGVGLFSVTGSISGLENSSLTAGADYLITASNANIRIDAATNYAVGDRYVMLVTGKTVYSSSLIVENEAVLPIDPSVPGVVTTEITNSLREGGTTATFTIRLASKPESDVTVRAFSSDSTEASVSPSTLFFTPDEDGDNAYWKTRTVTVTGLDDSLVDGTVDFQVQFSISSDDAGYDGISSTPLDGENIDDETYGVAYDFENLFTYESDNSLSNNAKDISFKLRSKPAADVVITLSNVDTTEGILDGTLVYTFTEDNWNSYQVFNVVGVQDTAKDGDKSYEIELNLASADVNFNGVETFFTLQNIDDDVSNVVISAMSNDLSEEGLTGYFTVQLTNSPSDNVTLTLYSSDANIAIPDREMIIFDSNNFDVPQRVTLFPLEDDDVLDGSATVQFDAIVSDNVDYNGLSPAEVSLTVLDNDDTGVTISALDRLPTENGDSARFYVHLDTQPSSDVVINVSSDDLTEGTVTPSTLTFTSDSWQGRQWVFVTGLDDSVVDGRVPYNIELEMTGAGDYVALGTLTKEIETIDNETPEIIITNTDLYSDEYGDQAAFEVYLSQLLGTGSTFDLVFTSDDTTEGDFSNSSTTISFDDANSTTIQNFKILGVSDNLNDGHSSYSVSATYSGNATFAALDLDSYFIVNNDKEVSAVVITEGQGVITEAGGTDTFAVRLQAEPTDTVTMVLSISDSGEALLQEGDSSNAASITLEFDSFNYNSPQTITVTGQDDADSDGEVPVYVNFSLSSNDTNYSGLTVPQVHFFNQDDDSIGIQLTVESSETTEAGGTANLVLSLSTQPTDVVILDVVISDPTEGNVVGDGSFVFNTSTWSSEQTLTLSGVDDGTADGDIDYTLTWTITTDDVNYSAATVPFVTLTNIDDDDARVILSDLDVLDNVIEGDTAVAFSANIQAALFAGNTVVLDVSVVSSDGNTQVSSDNTNFSANIALTFTDVNSTVDQLIYTKGLDNTLVDGDKSARLDFSIDSTSAVSNPEHDNILIDSISFTAQDDDNPGITLSTISNSVDETGTTATFSIQLDSIPSDNVTISFTSSDTSEVSISANSTIILNSLTAGTVTVTGIDDDFVDGDSDEVISVLLVTSDDDDYGGDSITYTDNVAVTNTDSGESINVSLTALTAVNEGDSSTFTFALNSQPTSDVVISLSSSSSMTFSPASVTFSSDSDFATTQSITYTSAENGVDNGTTYTQTISTLVTSSDADYSGFAIGDQSITITDDDSVSINFSAFSANIREDGDTATASVSLNSQPNGTGNVVLVITSSNTTELQLSHSVFVFDEDNWESAQTLEVTGLDDGLSDGDKTVTITVSSNSTLSETTDVSYDNDLLVATNSIDVFDVDSPGIIVVQDATSILENEGSASFQIYLNNSPDVSDNVIVSFTNATGNLVSNPAFVTFTSENFASIQNILVTSSSLVTANETDTIVASVSSGNYGASAETLTYTVLDGGTAQFSVLADDLQTSEDGDTATFDVSLVFQPTSDVTVNVTTSDSNEVDISNATLTFTSSNYDTVQIVTLTGADDSDLDGLADYTITLTGVQAGGSSEYAGVTSSIDYTNVDNDTPSIQLVYDTDLNTAEWGSSETIRLVLGSTPGSTVSVNVSVSDNLEASIDSSILLFSTSNGFENTVTVTGLDDSVQDGHKNFDLIFDTLISNDEDYDGLTVPDLTFLNIDDETSGIVVIENSTEQTPNDVSLFVQEISDGTSTDTFQVQLITAPSGNVVFNISTSDATEGTVSPSQIILTSTSASSTITLTGVDDDIVDGSEVFSVDLDIDASTTDPNFFGFPQINLEAVNESFGLEITDSANLSIEGGEYLFDLLTDGNTLTLTAEKGLAPFEWVIASDAYDNLSFTNLNSDNSQIQLVIGSVTDSYRISVTDSRVSSDNTTSYVMYVQGSPFISSINRPTPTTLQLFFSDILETSTSRFYNVYYSEDGINFTKINSSVLTSETVSASSKPTTLDSLMLTVDYDGSSAGFFSIVAVDSSGDEAPSISTDILTDETLNVKYEVQAADDQSVADTFGGSGSGGGGGGCLLK